jgi:hypothetical protein
LLRTNSIGMRSNRDYSQSPPASGHRLLCLGDSYTAGDGVENKARFSDCLERDYSNLEVLNFGLPGSGTDQQLLIFESLAKSFNADGVMLAFGVEDVQRNVLDIWPYRQRGSTTVWYMPKPYFTLEGGSLVLHNQPVPNVRVSKEDALKDMESAHIWRWNDIRSAAPKWAQEESLLKRLSVTLMNPYRGYGSEDNHEWKLMRTILDKLIQEVEGKPLFIIPLPSIYHCVMNLAPTYMHRLRNLRDSAKSVFVLDILPEFKAVPSQERKKCFRSDGHYSTLGHQVVARAISRAFCDYYPDVLAS